MCGSIRKLCQAGNGGRGAGAELGLATGVSAAISTED